MHEIERRFFAEGALVAGVLSGTSADGIDVGLARLRAERAPGGVRLLPPELVHFACEPFPDGLAGRVRGVLDGEPCGLREAALLDRDLGRAFGRAARAVAERAGFALDLVGSHGQTVWHHDGAESSGPATLQLGDGDCVAEECGAAVVSDFRRRDVAAGGEGAPLSPLADGLIFARVPRPAAILNLGGMGNLTLLLTGDRLLAFDTGPANSLLDGLARRFLDAPLDRDGAAAARGRPDEDLVRHLLQHPFFERPPPRSTGRDTFGERWVDEVVAAARARGAVGDGGADLLASATHLVAATVAGSLARFSPEPVAELVVAGGGVFHRTLMRALEQRSGVPVRSSAAHGVDPKAREALVFAVLAAACVLGIPLSHPGATGAPRGRCLGKISAAGCRVPDRG